MKHTNNEIEFLPFNDVSDERFVPETRAQRWTASALFVAVIVLMFAIAAAALEV